MIFSPSAHVITVISHRFFFLFSCQPLFWLCPSKYYDSRSSMPVETLIQSSQQYSTARAQQTVRASHFSHSCFQYISLQHMTYTPWEILKKIRQDFCPTPNPTHRSQFFISEHMSVILKWRVMPTTSYFPAEVINPVAWSQCPVPKHSLVKYSRLHHTSFLICSPVRT